MRSVHCPFAKTISSTLGDMEIFPNKLFKGLKKSQLISFSHEPHFPSDNMCFVEKVKDVYIDDAKIHFSDRFIIVRKHGASL